MRYSLLSILTLLLSTCTIAQKIEAVKFAGNMPVSSQSLIYSLPQTNIVVTVEVTKTTIKKGVYAGYAEKYLKLSNVPLKDSQNFAITNVKVYPQTEADPSQYYAITFKTFPDKLQYLFTVSKNGIVLDFANAWRKTVNNNLTVEVEDNQLIDPNLIEKTSVEKVDTLYKTVLTDSTFVRIPVFKKQIQAKTEEEIIQETANQLIKTRKHKIKILRGEYDFHPDGAALKVMVDELSKYEETLLSLFAGTRTSVKQYFTFTFIPQTGILSKELGYFSSEKGIQELKTAGCSVISVQLTKEQEPAMSVVPDKTKNTLYVRAPIMADVTVKLDENNLFSTRVPVYQFGPVMVMPLN